MQNDPDTPGTASIFTKQPQKPPPEAEYVSLTHALTWLAFRKSINAEELLIELARASPSDEDRARQELLQQLDRLTTAASLGRIPMIGSFVGPQHKLGAHPVRNQIPREAMFDFRRYDAFGDCLQRGWGLAWNLHSVGLDTATMPLPVEEYRLVVVGRTNLQMRLKPSLTWPGKPGKTPLAGASELVPSDDAIRQKAEEMRAAGLNGYQIASLMPNEPDFMNVTVTQVRAALKGQYRRGPRNKKDAH